MRYSKHIFICENIRAAGAAKKSCGASNSMQITEEFKKRLIEKGLHKTVRANKSGCLGVCEQGPALVIYPQGIWYGGVSVDDVDEIIGKSILRDEIIARLEIKDNK